MMSTNTHIPSLFKAGHLQFIVALLTVLAMSLGLATATRAAGNVTNCTDYSGIGGLQAALSGGGEVTFECDGTIVVPEIVIATDTTIDATDHTVTISGDNSNRVFFVSSGAKLELINVTIADGFAADDNGGGILNGGTVKLTNSTVSGNTATFDGGGILNLSGGTVELTNSTVSNNAVTFDGSGFLAEGGGIFNNGGTVKLANSTVSSNIANDRGGGIINSSGTMTLTNSIVSDNTANLYGGGIYNISDGTVTLTESTVGDNTANNFGGGIFNTISGKVKLVNSTVSGNTTNDRGGGIINFASGTVEVTNSTVSSNTADVAGGGIFNIGGTVTLTNSTISDNTTDLGGGGIINLRDFWLNDGLLTLINSTISGNSANGLSSEGGGIYNNSMVLLVNSTVSGNSATVGGGIFSVGGTVTLTNSIIAAQVIGPDCSGSITSNGYNLDSDGSCGLSATCDLTADPLLSPLQMNGGNTKTHALLDGSPAIDTGSCPGTTTDQRGFTRPVDIPTISNTDDGCDIGAYEFDSPQGPPTTPIYLPIVLKQS